MITHARNLTSLDSLHARRAEIHRKQREAKAVKPPALAELVAKAAKSHSISVETIEQLDAVYVAVDRLANLSPIDSKHLARTLLASALRLAWAKACGKAGANGDPVRLPLKLYSRGVVNRDQLRKLNEVLTSDSDTATCQECTKPLLIWLAR